MLKSQIIQDVSLELAACSEQGTMLGMLCVVAYEPASWAPTVPSCSPPCESKDCMDYNS